MPEVCMKCNSPNAVQWRQLEGGLVCSECDSKQRVQVPQTPEAAKLTTKICQNCKVTSTPRWRKSIKGLLCNSCGIYFKIWGKDRPLELQQRKVQREEMKNRNIGLPTLKSGSTNGTQLPSIQKLLREVPSISDKKIRTERRQNIYWNPRISYELSARPSLNTLKSPTSLKIAADTSSNLAIQPLPSFKFIQNSIQLNHEYSGNSFGARPRFQN